MTSAIREYMESFIARNGSAITVYAISSTAYSSYYHDKTITYDSGTSTYGLIVPEATDLVKSEEGELQRATLRMLIPYSITVANRYKITLGSIDYQIEKVDDYKYKDSTVANQVELSRMVST